MPAESALKCNRCEFVYSGIRQPGQRCNDLSWLDHEPFKPFHRFVSTLREHQRLMCRGRVWPPQDYTTGRRAHWSRERLFEEHKRLIESLPRYQAALARPRSSTEP